MKRFDEIVKKNCELLKIPAPAASVIPAGKLPTKTTRAAICWNGVNADDAELVVNKDFIILFERDPAQAWLAISHELRHLWQIRNSSTALAVYKDSQNEDVVGYNSQELEMDAWAWCVYIMQSELGVRPEFEKLFGAELAGEIIDRAKKIKSEVER